MPDQKKNLPTKKLITSSEEAIKSEGNIEDVNPAARDLYQYWMNTFDIFSASLIKEITKVLSMGVGNEKK